MEKKYQLAIDARCRAYAPYSHFLVGACVVLKNGQFIVGCNVENSSYGLSNCAERTALFSSVAAGYKKEDIAELIICTGNLIPSSPCGACRQVISELMMKDALVTLINPELKNTKTYFVKDLLPDAFNGDEL